MKLWISYILVCMMAFASTSCRDDFMAYDSVIGEGRAKVSAVVDFEPMSSGLIQTRTAGDAIKGITSLHVLLYDYETKNLTESWKIENYQSKDVDRIDTDAENGITAEAKTKRVFFELNKTIGKGKYIMYAVANIPDLLENYEKNIETVDGLKNIPLTWNDKNISENSQMIGYFTKNTTVQPEDNPLVINESEVRLHAWLRRATSKVTIAYDGSKLKEGVFIYRKSVQIKDIPEQCYLGKDNNVGFEGYSLKCPEKGPDMPDG